MAQSRQPYIHGTHADEQERLALLNRLSNRPFLDFLGPIHGIRMLEVGSGLGILAGEAARLNRGGETIGLEYAAAQLQAALRRPSRGAVFVRGDAHALPFPDQSYDLVYCRYLLEHVQDPVRVLREMHRVLVPGGRAAAQENNILVNQFYPDCPAFDSVWRSFVELQQNLGGDALIGKKLYTYFQQAGFRSIELTIQPEVHWHGSPGFEPWIRNLIGNVRSAQTELARRALASPDLIERAVHELEDLIDRRDASAYFYWNRASGRK